MTKSELIDRMVRNNDQLTSKDIETAVKLMIDQLGETLAKGDRIEIRGFGSFALHHRRPRTARNPKTGDAVNLTDRYVPRFKPGKELRDRVNAHNIRQAAAVPDRMGALSGGPVAPERMDTFNDGGVTPDR